MADKAKFNIQSVSQNHREVSCWRRCTACNSLHLHREDGLRFSNSKNCFFSQRMNSHIIRLSSPRFLVVAFFVVRAEFQAAVKCCLETYKCPKTRRHTEWRSHDIVARQLRILTRWKERFLKAWFSYLGKSRTVGDFIVSRPSQILPTNENFKS